MSFVLHGYLTYLTEAKRDEKRAAVQAYFDSNADAVPTACTVVASLANAGLADGVWDDLPGYSICYNLPNQDALNQTYVAFIDVGNPDSDPAETGNFHKGPSNDE